MAARDKTALGKKPHQARSEAGEMMSRELVPRHASLVVSIFEGVL